MANSLPRKLWEHPSPHSTAMDKFRRVMEKKTNREFKSFYEMYEWSIKHRATFWELCWNYFPIIYEGEHLEVVNESARIDSIPKWFSGVKLNFAENILFSAKKRSQVHSLSGKEDEKIAIIEAKEDAAETCFTWRQLRTEVGRLSSALRSAGLGKGDVVAAVASNSFTTLCIFLSTAAVGGIFTSMSTDMGSESILARLLQVTPKFLFFEDSARYNGKTIDLTSKFKEVCVNLERLDGFAKAILVPRGLDRPKGLKTRNQRGIQTIHEFTQQACINELTFQRVDFNDPFIIVYSSGTTGPPKCIAHSVGGVVLAAYRESGLHRNLSSRSTMLQFTTTGWIMYLISINSLLLGSTCVLYDGNPFYHGKDALLRLASRHRVTHLGISPKYLQELRQAGYVPREQLDLSVLENVVSTGMVLPDSLFEWFYETAFPPSTQLSNISGGTDIAGCFTLENPLTPVYQGGCQGPALGIELAAFDQAKDSTIAMKGCQVDDGTAGELVAIKAFPNMPTKFWGGCGAEQYQKAYFSKFDNVWTHGDWIVVHPQTRQITFLGRSDGILNPSGIRFGSAEIYNVIETTFSQVEDSLCIGRRRPQDMDEVVMLFLKMKSNQPLTQTLVVLVKQAIRTKLTARHVPAFILETPEIPTTLSGKKVETAVRNIVSGQDVPGTGLLNPDCLNYYKQFYYVENQITKARI